MTSQKTNIQIRAHFGSLTEDLDLIVKHLGQTTSNQSLKQEKQMQTGQDKKKKKYKIKLSEHAAVMEAQP